MGKSYLRIDQCTSSSRSTRLRNHLPWTFGFGGCIPNQKTRYYSTLFKDIMCLSSRKTLTSYFFHEAVHLGLHASVNSGSLSTGSSYISIHILKTIMATFTQHIKSLKCNSTSILTIFQKKYTNINRKKNDTANMTIEAKPPKY